MKQNWISTLLYCEKMKWFGIGLEIFVFSLEILKKFHHSPLTLEFHYHLRFYAKFHAFITLINFIFIMTFIKSAIHNSKRKSKIKSFWSKIVLFVSSIWFNGKRICHQKGNFNDRLCIYIFMSPEISARCSLFLSSW